MLFLALSPNNARALLVRAERWHDAQALSLRIFSDVVDRDKVLVTQTEDVGQQADLEIRWQGHDAGAHPNRTMEVREFAKGKWTKWRKA
jgi:hypothetical protein